MSQYSAQLTQLQDELLREMASLKEDVGRMRSRVRATVEAEDAGGGGGGGVPELS